MFLQILKVKLCPVTVGISFDSLQCSEDLCFLFLAESSGNKTKHRLLLFQEASPLSNMN